MYAIFRVLQMYSSLKREKTNLVCDTILLHCKPTGIFCCLSHILVFLPVYFNSDGRSFVSWCRRLDARRLLIAETLVRPQANEYGICGGQSSTRAGFSSQYFGCFSVNIVPAVLRTHSFIYHKFCISLAIIIVVK